MHTISYYKILAKKLKRAEAIKHTEALEKVAKQHGFNNWNCLLKSL